jgi:hypothetical protein
MLNAFNVLILTSVLGAASGHATDDQASLILGGFEEDCDVNYDRRPDGWKRELSPGYPAYLECQIAPDSTQPGNRVLAMRLNGGAIALESPEIDVSGQFTYVVSCRIRTDGLRHHRAGVSLSFLGADNSSQADTKVRQDAPFDDGHDRAGSWTTIVLGPLVPPSDATQIVARLSLEPGDPDGEGDITGAAFFDDLVVLRQPRLVVSMSRPEQIFSTPGEVGITCEVSGVPDPSAIVSLVIENERGVVVYQADAALSTQSEDVDSHHAPHRGTHSDHGHDPISTARFHGGRATWTPELPGLGFYRARIRLIHAPETRSNEEPLAAVPTTQPHPPTTVVGDSSHNSEEHSPKTPQRAAETVGSRLPSRTHERVAEFVIAEPAAPPPVGEFGWSFPEGELPIPLDDLPRLIKQGGVNWMKLPVWNRCQNAERLIELSSLTERLLADGVRVIGVLESPPEAVRKSLSLSDNSTAADVFVADPSIWFPTLEPILVRLLRVRWWQLGSDDDHSFEGLSGFSDAADRARSPLSKFGSDLKMGTSWRWLVERPDIRQGAIQFLHFESDVPLTPDDVEEFLAKSRDSDYERWLSLKPLTHGDYGADVRVRDLARRMIAAKQYGADKIMFPVSFGDEQSVLNEDGTPGELFLPWRTAARAMAGKSFVGSLELPARSPNALFASGGDATLAVWSDHDHEETIVTGDRVKITDVWGRPHPAEVSREGYRLRVGPAPIFLQGLDASLARFQMGLVIANPLIPALRGRPVTIEFIIPNPFSQAISGRLELELPPEMETWKFEPRTIDFHIAPGQIARESLEVRVPFDAATKAYDLRLRVELSGLDRRTLYLSRRLEVGFPDFQVELAQRFDEDGTLIVEQRMESASSDPTHFECFLKASGRPPLRESIRNLTRNAELIEYRIPEARDLVGSTLLLRVREQDGPRFMNYYLTVEDAL